MTALLPASPVTVDMQWPFTDRPITAALRREAAARYAGKGPEEIQRLLAPGERVVGRSGDVLVLERPDLSAGDTPGCVYRTCGPGVDPGGWLDPSAAPRTDIGRRPLFGG